MKAILVTILLGLTPLCHGSNRPNVLFILADDWGYGDVSVYNTMLQDGIEKPATPNLQRLADQGVTLTHFRSLGAECTPSRASFMTGRSPSDPAVGLPLVVSGSAKVNKAKGLYNFLPTKTLTMTKMMQNAGYYTGHFGKWHLGDFKGNSTTPSSPAPTAYGINTTRCYVCLADANSSYNTADLWWPSNSSRVIVDDTIAAIEEAQQAEQPFYINTWIHISHAPMLPTADQYMAHAKWLDPNVRDPVTLCTGPDESPHKGGYGYCPIQVYRASQFEADAQIGRLLAYLDEQGLSNDTIVVFSTDNGPEDPHIYFNSVGDPGPFRGRKRSLYDGGVHLPFLIRWPHRLPQGVKTAVQMMSADLMPTLASLTNVPLDHTGLFGVDVSAYLLEPSRGIYPARKQPIMFDYRYDALSGYCYHESPRFSILHEDVKYLVNPDGSRPEMYNLTQRTFEALGVLQDNQMLATHLQQQLFNWSTTLVPDVIRARHQGCLNYHYPT